MAALTPSADIDDEHATPPITTSFCGSHAESGYDIADHAASPSLLPRSPDGMVVMITHNAGQCQEAVRPMRIEPVEAAQYIQGSPLSPPIMPRREAAWRHEDAYTPYSRRYDKIELFWGVRHGA